MVSTAWLRVATAIYRLINQRRRDGRGLKMKFVREDRKMVINS